MSQWRTTLGKTVQELRVQFSQTNKSSVGLRNWIKKEYVDLKKANPRLPILIREHTTTEPRLTARYDYGIEKTIQVSDVTESDIESKINELIQYGQSLPKHEDKKQQKQVTQ